MTACQKIKREILSMVRESFKLYADDLSDEDQKILKMLEVDITEENLESLYDDLEDVAYEYKEDFRHSGIPTGLPSDRSRHYECEEVATKLEDGSWIGWTHWHGEGKHGDPYAIPWMKDAYDLKVTETEKLVVVREFEKIPPKGKL